MCISEIPQESLMFHLATQWTGTKYWQTVNPLFVPNQPGGLSRITTCLYVRDSVCVCFCVWASVSSTAKTFTSQYEMARLQETQQLNLANK